MKKVLVLTVLVLCMALGVTLVSADTDTLPTAPWEVGIQIQNAGASDATVVLTAYDQVGAPFACDDATLAPGASFTWLSANCTTAAGFVGSGVASADQPINAVVNVNNRTAGAAAGQYTGTDGADVATSISFPLVKHNHAGRTTTFFIQNATGAVNDISVVFTQSGTNATFTHDYPDVPAYAMVVVSPSDAAFPSGTGTGIGGLVVTGTGAVAGSSLEHEHAPAGVPANLQASRAFTPSDSDTNLSCPLSRFSFGALDTTTGLQVQNVSGAPIDIDVTYNVIFPAARTVTVPTVTGVADGASANFLASDHLTDGELASISVTATGDVVAITNDRADAPTPKRFTTYACFGDTGATNTVSLPLVKEDFFNNTTGVQVQNVGAAGATFTLTYITNNGDTVVVQNSVPVAAGASKTFFRLAAGGTGEITVTSGALADLASTVSGVVITSDQPIVAIANESNYTGVTPQDTKNYEGFNQ